MAYHVWRHINNEKDVLIMWPVILLNIIVITCQIALMTFLTHRFLKKGKFTFYQKGSTIPITFSREKEPEKFWGAMFIMYLMAVVVTTVFLIFASKTLASAFRSWCDLVVS